MHTWRPVPTLYSCFIQLILPWQSLYQNGSLPLIYTAAIYNSFMGNAQTLFDWRDLCVITTYNTYKECTHGVLSLLYTAAIHNSYCQGELSIRIQASP